MWYSTTTNFVTFKCLWKIVWITVKSCLNFAVGWGDFLHMIKGINLTWSCCCSNFRIFIFMRLNLNAIHTKALHGDIINYLKNSVEKRQVSHNLLIDKCNIKVTLHLLIIIFPYCHIHKHTVTSSYTVSLFRFILMKLPLLIILDLHNMTLFTT